MYIRAKSQVPLAGRMYFSAIASTCLRTSRPNCCRARRRSDSSSALARPPEVLERELAVDRHEPVLDEDHGVDDEPVAQRMLDREGGRRQNLGEGLLEEHFPERAPQLRRLEEVLEAGHVPGELLDLLGGLVQPSEPLAHLLEQVVGLAQMVGEALLPRGHSLLDPLDPDVHRAPEVLESAIDGLRSLARPRRLRQDLVETRDRGGVPRAGPREDQTRRGDHREARRRHEHNRPQYPSFFKDNHLADK